MSRPQSNRVSIGWNTPVDFAPFQEGSVILERDLGQLSLWSDTDDTRRGVVDGLNAPSHVATQGDSIWIAEETGRILHWANSEVQNEWTNEEGDVFDLITDSQGVAWIQEDQAVSYR